MSTITIIEAAPHKLCSVCQNKHHKLYSVAQCVHSFCQTCSIGYISSQASNFAEARCLQESCGAPLDKALPIYRLLDPSTTHKIQQFQTYKFLQEHLSYSGCKAADCAGVFRIKQGKCQKCESRHCKRCLRLFHPGKCVESVEQKQMKRLRYQKCPTCRAWVQKKQGCQYVTCKCGIDFCYRCGYQFSKCVCRLSKQWESQIQIRALLGKIPNLLSCKPLNLLLLPLKIIILLTLVVPCTLILCLTTTIFVLSVFFVLVTFVTPFALCQPISEMESSGNKCLSIIALLIVYPFLCTLAALVYVIAVLLYPWSRNWDHHGIYDALDTIIANVSICYLSCIVAIFSCLECS